MRITVCGKHWDLVFGDLPRGTHGVCDRPDIVGKKITISKSIKGDKLVDTVIHELLHACLWDLDEEKVAEAATSITRVLKRLELI